MCESLGVRKVLRGRKGAKSGTFFDMKHFSHMGGRRDAVGLAGHIGYVLGGMGGAGVAGAGAARGE